MEPEMIVGLVVFFGAVLVMGITIFIKSQLEICQPNEVMIFSGRRYRTKDGTVVGYRAVRGGRALRVPLVERVSRLSLNTIPIDMDVSGALTKGVIPLNVQARANVKIAGTEEKGLGNAIERFLGKGPNVITGIAKEIVEGNMRGVLATMLPEEANASRLVLAQKIADEARLDLERMGLILDTLKIQQITDDKGYLEAITRKKNAEVKRDARIAEAASNAEASQKESESKKLAEITEIESRKAVVEAERAFRVEQAAWTAEANRAEERAKMAGEISLMEEKATLEERRVEVSKLRSQAEVVIPAVAEQEAERMRAAGKAAHTYEEGKAKAEALKLLREQWEREDSKDLFVIQILPELVDKVAQVISSNLSVERLTVVDGGGNGTGGVPRLVGNLAGSVNAFMEQLKTLSGLDVARIMEERCSTAKERAARCT